MLIDKEIPYDKKQELADSILSKYLNLKTARGLLNAAICIASLLYIFSVHNAAGLHIMMVRLIKPIKDGKISKLIARAIIRLVKRNGVDIDPELVEVAYD